jgi:DNA-binding transcriptional regulator YiaG
MVFIPLFVNYQTDIPYTPAEIKALRRREGMTAEMLAFLCGVGRQTVTTWEEGKWKPGGSHMMILRLIDLYPELFFARHTEY